MFNLEFSGELLIGFEQGKDIVKRFVGNISLSVMNWMN